MVVEPETPTSPGASPAEAPGSQAHFSSLVDKCEDGGQLCRILPVLMRQAGEQQPIFIEKLKTLLKSISFPPLALQLACRTLEPPSSKSAFALGTAGKRPPAAGEEKPQDKDAVLPNAGSAATAEQANPTSAGAPPAAKRQKLNLMRTMANLSASSNPATSSISEGNAQQAQQGEEAQAPKKFAVYMHNILYSVDESRIRTFLQQRGIRDIKSINMLKTPAGKSKGACQIVFASQAEMTIALGLNESQELDMEGGRKIYVREDLYAHQSQELGEHKATTASTNAPSAFKPSAKDLHSASGSSTSNSGSSVIVKNLAFTASEANLGELFAGVGEIRAVRLARQANGKPAGYAIVEFTHPGAVAPALARSGANIKNRPVRVEAMRGTSGGGGGAPQNGAVVEGSPTSGAAQANKTSSLSDKLATLDADAQKEAGTSGNDAATTTTEQKPAGLSSFFCKKDETMDYAGLLTMVSKFESIEALKKDITEEQAKSWLSGVGLKAGGTFEERAQRLWRVREFENFDDIPKDLKPGPAKINKKKPDYLGNKGGKKGGQKDGDAAEAGGAEAKD
ncbi:unnamed protein product [Amoebophrya sp. A25]|nr:unnamed protein product [Amoebophrya sp. A25]|eukprot:GSA25T00018472001.1